MENKYFSKGVPVKDTKYFDNFEGGVIIIIGTDKDFVYKMVRRYPQFTFINIVRSKDVLYAITHWCNLVIIIQSLISYIQK